MLTRTCFGRVRSTCAFIFPLLEKIGGFLTIVASLGSMIWFLSKPPFEKELDKLEEIDLSECRHFVELPDLSKASRLKLVNLSGCEKLWYLHQSVLSSNTLITLILGRCTNLRSVRGRKHLKSLEKISVNGYTSLEEFAVSSDLIENLNLSSTGIQTLDLSIGRLHNLKRLNLESLRLNHLPKVLSSDSSLTSVKELKISGSGLMVEKQELHVLFHGLRSLQILSLKDCRNLFELPENISVLLQLQELRLEEPDTTAFCVFVGYLNQLVCGVFLRSENGGGKDFEFFEFCFLKLLLAHLLDFI